MYTTYFPQLLLLRPPKLGKAFPLCLLRRVVLTLMSALSDVDNLLWYEQLQHKEKVHFQHGKVIEIIQQGRNTVFVLYKVCHCKVTNLSSGFARSCCLQFVQMALAEATRKPAGLLLLPSQSNRFLDVFVCGQCITVYNSFQK